MVQSFIFQNQKKQKFWKVTFFLNNIFILCYSTIYILLTHAPLLTYLTESCLCVVSVNISVFFIFYYFNIWIFFLLFKGATNK